MSKPFEITKHECKPGKNSLSVMHHDTRAPNSLHLTFFLLLSRQGPVEICS